MPRKATTHRLKVPGNRHTPIAKALNISESEKIRNGGQWQKVRRVKRKINPLCEDPLGNHSGRTVAAEEVHHLKPLAKYPELAFTLSNLQSLCRNCHHEIENGKTSMT